jgi:hypothetical protein
VSVLAHVNLSNLAEIDFHFLFPHSYPTLYPGSSTGLCVKYCFLFDPVLIQKFLEGQILRIVFGHEILQ